METVQIDAKRVCVHSPQTAERWIIVLGRWSVTFPPHSTVGPTTNSPDAHLL
jgi:hypothetical protein